MILEYKNVQLNNFSGQSIPKKKQIKLHELDLENQNILEKNIHKIQ